MPLTDLLTRILQMRSGFLLSKARLSAPIAKKEVYLPADFICVIIFIAELPACGYFLEKLS